MDLTRIDLFQSRQMLESIMTIMTEGVLILNTDNEIEMANASAMRYLDCDAEGLIGRSVEPLFHNPQEIVNLNIALEEIGRLEGIETILRTPSGRDFYARFSGFQMIEEVTRVNLTIILFYDISDRKAAEKRVAEYTRKLEKNNRDLDEFAHIVSHDLKAPLRAISNLSMWLQEDLGTNLPPDSTQNLTLLRNRVTRMESLINGILEYSKVGREQLETKRIDVLPLLQEIVELLSPPEHITVAIDAKMPVLDTPRIMLFQVFSNLISNAIKYNSKPAGSVKVYGEDHGPFWEFVVEDNGVGIEEQYHDKIFGIFQTLQARDKVESTGIGLAIVKRILSSIGGTIRVESVVNEGTKFIFTWPVRLTQNTSN